MEQCCFAASVRSYDRHHVFIVHGEVDIVEYLTRAVGETHVFELDDG